MLAPNPIFTRADELGELFAPAVVDIFAGCGGWSIGTEQAFVAAGFRDRRVDLMVNHWQTAVGVHRVNHPLTEHLRADVREVDPLAVLPGRRIAYLHASPDCTDHSKAKGGKPRRKEIRALADVVIVWAEKRRPDVITLENVEEFEQWGPLHADGTPDKGRRGHEFARWCGELRDLGYFVEWRVLRACDYGAPTTRKRLFVVARCDGKRIVWPEKTHGPKNVPEGSTKRPRHHVERRSGRDARRLTGRRLPSREAVFEEAARSGTRRSVPADSCRRLTPYRVAADCIDWSIPMLSIFATPAEASAFAKRYGVGIPRRPLKPKTLARIAGGLDKFVLRAAKPFIVRIAHGDHSDGSARWGHTTHDAGQPLGTVTGSKDYAVADVTLAPYSVPRYGERPGQPPRCQSIDEPAATITGTGNGSTPVAVTLQTLNHGGPEHRATSPDAPLPTVCGSNDARALVAALVTKHYGNPGYAERPGIPADVPLSTVTASDHHAVTCAYLSHFYTSNSRGGEGDPLKPAKTITSGGQHAAVTVALANPIEQEQQHDPDHLLLQQKQHLDAGLSGDGRRTQRGEGGDRSCDARGVLRDQQGGRGDPLAPAQRPLDQAPRTAVPYLVSAGGATYAAKPKSAEEPANTVVVNDRRAIVAAFLATYYGNGGTSTPADPMPTVVGKDRIQLVTVTIDGTTYVITDIAMRMLTPRELANAQGFPADYVIDRTADGRPVSKADQVKLIGNAVPPAFARAIVKANVIDQGVLGVPPRRRRRAARKAVAA